jgi:hypothetical protein
MTRIMAMVMDQGDTDILHIGYLDFIAYRLDTSIVFLLSTTGLSRSIIPLVCPSRSLRMRSSIILRHRTDLDTSRS